MEANDATYDERTLRREMKSSGLNSPERGTYRFRSSYCEELEELIIFLVSETLIIANRILHVFSNR